MNFHRNSLRSLLPLACLFVSCVLGWVNRSAGAPLEGIEGVLCRMGASDGVRRYSPGRWGVVEVYAVNRTEKLATTQAVLRFSDDPTLQYGRRVVVPPMSVLRTTCPVLVPGFPTGPVVDFVSEQVDPRTGQYADRRSAHESLLMPQSLILDYEFPSVAMISDFRPPEYSLDQLPYYTGAPYYPPAPDTPAYELALAAKRAKLMSRRISVLDPSEIPADLATLDLVDTIVLSSDRLGDYPAGIALLRNWVMGGGSLCIMLDEVSGDTVTKIMGSAFRCALIDTTRLTEFVVESERTDVASPPLTEIHLDEPVTLVRLIAEGVTVTERVGDWPAVFWQPFGGGKVFFTAIGPAALMRRTAYSDPPPRTIDDTTNYFPRPPLQFLAADCIVPKQMPILEESTLQPFLSEQIGYRIVGRSLVAGILGMFCVGLAVASAWSLHRGQAERILWLAPLAALATTLIFFWIARSTKQAVPPTVAAVTRLLLEPGNATGHVHGLAAIYNQSANSDSLGAELGGMFFPDMTAMTGRRRRITWTDEGMWHWEELQLPAGVRTAPFESQLVFQAPADCWARFGANGLTGQIDLDAFDKLEDAVIMIPRQPAMGVTIRDGLFDAGTDQVLAPSTYLSGTLLSDAQRRRKNVYERLFEQTADDADPSAAVLYAWADAAKLGFVFPQQNQLGSTLLSIPLRIERSPPGALVTVPSPFLPYRAVPDARGRPPSAYGNLRREWTESQLSVTDWVRFQFPAAVLPLRAERARVLINLRAPSRSVEVLTMSAGEPTVVGRLRHPIGTYPIEIEDPKLLQLDSAGGLRLAIQVGDDEGANQADASTHGAWKIESLGIEVTGTVEE